MKKEKTKEVVINTCYGGFGLSDLAYKELIKMGFPVKKYASGIEGKVSIDRALTPKGEDTLNDLYWKYKGKSSLEQRYWEIWLDKDRENPLLIKVIKKLGKKANSWASDLKIVKIPIGIKYTIKYTIEGYDGLEHIAEEHRTWS